MSKNLNALCLDGKGGVKTVGDMLTDMMADEQARNRIVGECNRCRDPIYAFQLVKDNMHEGCSKLVWNKSKKEWE